MFIYVCNNNCTQKESYLQKILFGFKPEIGLGKTCNLLKAAILTLVLLLNVGYV